MVPAIVRSLPSGPGPGRRSALVVDRSPHVRATLVEALARAGVGETRVAADGAEAVAALGAGSPDLLILDWELAAIPAPEVMRVARDATGRDLPVIVTMAEPCRSAVEAALAEGVTSVVGKPLSIARLLQRIEAAFARA